MARNRIFVDSAAIIITETAEAATIAMVTAAKMARNRIVLDSTAAIITATTAATTETAIATETAAGTIATAETTTNEFDRYSKERKRSGGDKTEADQSSLSAISSCSNNNCSSSSGGRIYRSPAFRQQSLVDRMGGNNGVELSYSLLAGRNDELAEFNFPVTMVMTPPLAPPTIASRQMSLVNEIEYEMDRRRQSSSASTAASTNSKSVAKQSALVAVVGRTAEAPAAATAVCSGKASYDGPHYYSTLYDCSADNPDELSFEVGEVVRLLREEDEDWWEGEIEGHPERRGLFPATFVRPLDPSSDSGLFRRCSSTSTTTSPTTTTTTTTLEIGSGIKPNDSAARDDYSTARGENVLSLFFNAGGRKTGCIVAGGKPNLKTKPDLTGAGVLNRFKPTAIPSGGGDYIGKTTTTTTTSPPPPLPPVTDIDDRRCSTSAVDKSFSAVAATTTAKTTSDYEFFAVAETTTTTTRDYGSSISVSSPGGCVGSFPPPDAYSDTTVPAAGLSSEKKKKKITPATTLGSVTSLIDRRSDETSPQEKKEKIAFAAAIKNYSTSPFPAPVAAATYNFSPSSANHCPRRTAAALSPPLTNLPPSVGTALSPPSINLSPSFGTTQFPPSTNLSPSSSGTIQSPPSTNPSSPPSSSSSVVVGATINRIVVPIISNNDDDDSFPPPTTTTAASGGIRNIRRADAWMMERNKKITGGSATTTTTTNTTAAKSTAAIATATATTTATASETVVGTAAGFFDYSLRKMAAPSYVAEIAPATKLSATNNNNNLLSPGTDVLTADAGDTNSTTLPLSAVNRAGHNNHSSDSSLNIISKNNNNNNNIKVDTFIDTSSSTSTNTDTNTSTNTSKNTLSNTLSNTSKNTLSNTRHRRGPEDVTTHSDTLKDVGHLHSIPINKTSPTPSSSATTTINNNNNNKNINNNNNNINNTAKKRNINIQHRNALYSPVADISVGRATTNKNHSKEGLSLATNNNNPSMEGLNQTTYKNHSKEGMSLATNNNNPTKEGLSLATNNNNPSKEGLSLTTNNKNHSKEGLSLATNNNLGLNIARTNQEVRRGKETITCRKGNGCDDPITMEL